MDKAAMSADGESGSKRGQKGNHPNDIGPISECQTGRQEDAEVVHHVEHPDSLGCTEAPREPVTQPSGPTRVASQRKTERKAHSLIDKVYSWNNLWTAWRRVRRNKGAHGLDRVSIHTYEQDVEKHLTELQRKLKERRYEPTPVRRVYIPKGHDSKERRPLGIPTVTDRVCQQAVFQVLAPIFESGFSDRSYGFRPHRKAHHAIATAIQDGQEGYKCVVDADIASFFDRLDHGVVMSHVSAKVADGRVLGLIEAFLKAGICEDNVVSVPVEGTPQGGVISPLLANIVLDAFDKALEEKGWRHVRYADDFVILTRTAEEAAQALAYAKEVLGELKLSLHETKTSVTGFAKGFDFLGFRFRRYRLGVRSKSVESLKERIRTATQRQQGRNVDAVIQDLNPILRGWSNYFGVAEVSDLFNKLDMWIRMRIRAFRLKRRARTSNGRIPNRRLEKWGLLSLTSCRPAHRLSYMRVKAPESGPGLLAMRTPHGVAQCGNATC